MRLISSPSQLVPFWAVLVFVVFALAVPSWGELVDPGAGLATRAERRTARLDTWQPIWEGFTNEQKQDQSRLMLQDHYDDACLLAAVRAHANDPGMAVPAAREYIEDAIANRNPTAVIAWINNYGCRPETNYTPEPDDQGGYIHKTLVINGTARASGIRNIMPVLPRIGAASSVGWGSPGHLVCTIGATDYQIYATRHKLHEAHIHLLEAIVTAEGALSYFYLVDELSELPCDTITSPTP